MLVQLHAYKIACGYPSYGLRCDIRPNSSLPIPQPISRRPMPYCGASYKVGKLPDPHTSKRLRIKASPHFPHKSGLSHYKVRLPDRQTTVRPAAAFEIRTVFLWWMRYRNIAGINLRLQRSLHPTPHETRLRSRSMRRSLPAAISGRSNPALPTPYHVHTPGKCPYIVRTAFSA